MLTRRNALPLAALTLAGAVPRPARAQAQFPDQPIRFIIPYPPGGAADVFARIIGRAIGERLGQPFVIDNRTGAGGVIGVEALTRSRPDGHTLTLASPGPLVLQPHLMARLPYDVTRDLTPISLVLTVQQVLVVNNDVPARTVEELIALARQRPGHYTFGSAGAGGSVHLSAEMFCDRAGIRMVHVPYRGAGPAVNDLIAHQIDMMVADAPGVIGQVKGGLLRALAVMGPNRSPELPNVPTVSESALPGLATEGWYALLGPAGLPLDRVRILHAALASSLADGNVRRALVEQGAEIRGSTPEDLSRHLRIEFDKWGGLLRHLQIQLN